MHIKEKRVDSETASLDWSFWAEPACLRGQRTSDPADLSLEHSGALRQVNPLNGKRFSFLFLLQQETRTNFLVVSLETDFGGLLMTIKLSPITMTGQFTTVIFKSRKLSSQADARVRRCHLVFTAGSWRCASGLCKASYLVTYRRIGQMQVVCCCSRDEVLRMDNLNGFKQLKLITSILSLLFLLSILGHLINKGLSRILSTKKLLVLSRPAKASSKCSAEQILIGRQTVDLSFFWLKFNGQQ